MMKWSGAQFLDQTLAGGMSESEVFQERPWGTHLEQVASGVGHLLQAFAPVLYSSWFLKGTYVSGACPYLTSSLEPGFK